MRLRTLELELDLGAVQRDPHQTLSDGAILLAGFAINDAGVLLAALRAIVAVAPFRHMVPPGGWPMSVAMSNCG